MANRGEDRSTGADAVGLIATLRHLFGKRSTVRGAGGGGNTLSDRVVEVSHRVGPQGLTHCPECGFGILRVVVERPSRTALPGHGAFQKLPPAPGSLQCDHCSYLMRRQE